MTLAQLAALIDVENALNAPASSTARGPEPGTSDDLRMLASLGG
jgi:hypothetical protein